MPYLMIKSFNNLLINDIVSFDQLDPGCIKHLHGLILYTKQGQSSVQALPPELKVTEHNIKH